MSAQTTGDKLTEGQLDAAMNLGLYSRNKYLLQSMPADQVDLMRWPRRMVRLRFRGKF